VLRDGKLVDELWHKVVVGDVIKMDNDQFVAVSITATAITTTTITLRFKISDTLCFKHAHR